MQTSLTRRSGIILAGLAVLSAPALARAADSNADDTVSELGLDPGEPQAPSPPPAIPFGVQPAQSREYVLDFHGYLLLPANVGIHQRLMPAVGQSGTVLHSPPLIPQDLRDFAYTGVVPNPWLQLNFVYGNRIVSATVILAGTQAMDAAGYYNPVGQMGVNDAFVTVNLSRTLGFPVHVNVGAMTGRYGAMGAYDAGRYGTPLIAQTNTIGEQITAAYNVGQVVFLLDQGLGGQLGRPPVGLVPAGWNDFADANVGATFVNQAHVGIGYRPLGRIGLHYVTAWTQDDLVANGTVPNGRITVLGADLNLTMGRAGHLYLGAARTYLTNAATVSGAIEVLNARGGPELVAHYLDGPSPTSSATYPAGNGTGSLSTFGGQYDLSFARLIFGKQYIGASPDLLLSLFGVGTYVKSDDNPLYNDVLKLKGGAEVTYAFLSWLGVSERFDHVRLHGSDSTQAFSSITSRLLFHTGWRSRGEIALQYTYFMYGSGVYVETGYPAMLDPNANPDKQVLSLIGTFWW